MQKGASTSQPGNAFRFIPTEKLVWRYTAVGQTPLQYPPCVKNLRRKPCSWKSWWVPAHWSGAAKTICGTICSGRVGRFSGWDLAEAKMPTVWSRTKQSRTMWETTTNSMTCDGYLQGIYSGPFSQQSPGRKPDHRCKNACLPVSFCSSCFSVAVLHYKYLVTSSVLQCLTC